MSMKAQTGMKAGIDRDGLEHEGSQGKNGGGVKTKSQ
jgi:hypothetical protein